MAENLYKTVSGNLSLYGSTVTNGTEPNMRQEMINTLDGFSPEIAKSQPGLLRKMRRDSAGKPIPCECVDTVTKEPDKDRFCPVCFGEGYKWDETQVKLYRTVQGADSSNTTLDVLTPAGLINIPLVVFYLRYSNEITKEDKIITLTLEANGTASSPLKRRQVFRIEHLWDYRADNGKLEYWKAFAHTESVKYLNAPSYSNL